MTALNKQALIAKIKKQTESFDTVVLQEDEANALLDALEAAENNLIDSECHVAELEEALRDKQALLEALDNSLCELLPGTQYMDPPDGGSVTPLEQVRRMVADYRNQIAELEARTITVKFEPIPMEELGNRRDGKKHPYMFGAGYNSAVVHCESVLHQACAAAGIGVKGE